MKAGPVVGLGSGRQHGEGWPCHLCYGPKQRPMPCWGIFEEADIAATLETGDENLKGLSPEQRCQPGRAERPSNSRFGPK